MPRDGDELTGGTNLDPAQLMEKITDLIAQDTILAVNRSAADRSIYHDYQLINGMMTLNACGDGDRSILLYNKPGAG